MQSIEAQMAGSICRFDKSSHNHPAHEYSFHFHGACVWQTFDATSTSNPMTISLTRRLLSEWHSHRTTIKKWEKLLVENLAKGFSTLLVCCCWLFTYFFHFFFNLSSRFWSLRAYRHLTFADFMATLYGGVPCAFDPSYFKGKIAHFYSDSFSFSLILYGISHWMECTLWAIFSSFCVCSSWFANCCMFYIANGWVTTIFPRFVMKTINKWKRNRNTDQKHEPRLLS